MRAAITIVEANDCPGRVAIENPLESEDVTLGREPFMPPEWMTLAALMKPNKNEALARGRE